MLQALAMYPARPLWNSRTKAFQGIGVPSTSSRGDYVRCVMRTSALFFSSRLSMD